MNRLDFSSIMAVIRYYISPDHGMNQGELLDELFYSLHAESKAPIIFDGASINRWLKGAERVSPVISRYYLKKRNQEKLVNDIEQYILPLMYDSDMAVQALYRRTVQDTTISDRKKNMLLNGYPCDTEQESAQLIAALLCFAMERTFVRRTAENTLLMATTSLSPASADFILNNRVPIPCRHFCGRDAELSVLHDLLNEHGKVFITGIPGIGKSEVAKSYAKQHKADYTNIVHLYYTGSLRKDITRMDFVDDLPDDTADARYERHARFLRTLKEDISFKNKKKVRKPVDEWFKVENTHEAIISEEDFRRVQEMIDTRRRSQKNGELQLFAGLIKCADCGWSLGHGRRKTKNGYDGYYHCSKNGQGLHQCSMHYIRDDVLCAYVLSRLQYWSQQAQQNEETLLKRLMGATDRERSAAKKKQAAELRKAEKRKAEIDSLFMKMYEDWSAEQRSLPDAAGRLIQVQLDRQKQPFVLSSNHTGEHAKELLFMTTFNFDMHRIGQTIARLRRERNMTQMQLADEMGVSFQAVSNWERGQSMPDISKLPELAMLFGTTIDALLGRHSPLIEKAAENKLDELPEVSVEELTAAAPILPPKQIESLTDTLMGLTDLPDMTELLRFLPTTKVDALLQRRMEAGKPLKEYALFASTNAVDAAARAHEQQGLPIDDIAPFMSTDCVIEIARSRTAAGRSIAELLPFLYEDSVNELARQRDALGHSIDDLLPFMSEDAVDAAARAHEQQGLSIDDIAPFMSTDCVIEIARSRTAAGRSIAELLPFLYENSVNELASQRDALGHSIDDFLPFMSEDALAEIALSRLQRGQKITNLLPFVGESLITRLAEAASSKD